MGADRPADGQQLKLFFPSLSPGRADVETGTRQMQSVERLTRSAKETFEVARQLGEELAGGEVLALVGDLGAGKTTFTRGLVCGTGCEEYMRVNSPTYVLEQVYQGRIPVRHYDAYRLDSPYELEDLGFQEALSTEAVLVIEWADRVQSLLPADSLFLELSFASPDGAEEGPGNTRLLRFSSADGSWERRLAGLSRRADNE